MKWSDHPVAHLRKIASEYKKELSIGAVSKMSKSDLIALLDKHLILGEDGKISVKAKYIQSKPLDIKIEEPKEKAKPKAKKEIVKMAKEIKKEVEKKEMKPLKKIIKRKEKVVLEEKKEEPKKEQKKEETTKSVSRQGKGTTKQEVINEWDTPTIGTIYSQYLLSQKDTKQAESLMKWVENKNKKGMPIFDDLGLTFTKEFNDAVFEKYGRDVLFEGLRRIFKSFDADKVVDMDKPPIQRTIKGMNAKNTKILQTIEDKKK